MAGPLIICIGNVARGDDGVAHRVAELLEASKGLSSERVLRAVDLDIVMAEQVARADVVVIVDAVRREDPAVSTEPLRPGPSRPTGHGIDPPGLLTLARELYGAEPTSWLVAVAAPNMAHGDGLSETAEAASIEAASVVMSLIGDAG